MSQFLFYSDQNMKYHIIHTMQTQYTVKTQCNQEEDLKAVHSELFHHDKPVNVT